MSYRMACLQRENIFTNFMNRPPFIKYLFETLLISMQSMMIHESFLLLFYMNYNANINKNLSSYQVNHVFQYL